MVVGVVVSMKWKPREQEIDLPTLKERFWAGKLETTTITTHSD